MQFFKSFIIALFILSLASCAVGYKTVDVKNQRGGNHFASDGVTLVYNYDVLKKRYNKKEHTKKIRVVQVKISNFSGQDLTFGKEIKIADLQGTERYLLTTEKIFSSLKQHPATYLFYLAFTPVKLTVTKGYQQSVTPIGYILGPALALGNVIVATSANDKFRLQLEETNIQGKIIRNGETIYGLIGIEAIGSTSLGLKVELP